MTLILWLSLLSMIACTAIHAATIGMLGGSYTNKNNHRHLMRGGRRVGRSVGGGGGGGGVAVPQSPVRNKQSFLQLGALRQKRPPLPRYPPNTPQPYPGLLLPPHYDGDVELPSSADHHHHHHRMQLAMAMAMASTVPPSVRREDRQQMTPASQPQSPIADREKEWQSSTSKEFMQRTHLSDDFPGELLAIMALMEITSEKIPLGSTDDLSLLSSASASASTMDDLFTSSDTINSNLDSSGSGSDSSEEEGGDREDSLTEYFSRRFKYFPIGFTQANSTKLCLSVHARMLPNGRFDIAIIVPGTRKLRHWLMNLDLALVPFTVESLADSTGYLMKSESDLSLEKQQQQQQQQPSVSIVDNGLVGESEHQKPPRVSRGFLRAYKSIRRQFLREIFSAIEKVGGPKAIDKITFFGHSLGGAICDQALFELDDILRFTYPKKFLRHIKYRLIKMGSPKTGNRRFAEQMAQKLGFYGRSPNLSLEVIHPKDPVPIGSLGMARIQGEKYCRTPGFLLKLPAYRLGDFTNHMTSTYRKALIKFFRSYLSTPYFDGDPNYYDDDDYFSGE